MRSGAFALGLVGGLIALAIGVVGFTAGRIGAAHGVVLSGFVTFCSLAIPVAGLAGAAIVRSRPLIGALLMWAATAALVALLGLNCVSVAPAVLLGLGGVIGLMARGDKR